MLLLDTDYEAMGRSLAGQGIGAVVGCLTTGFIVDRCQKWLDLFLAVSLFMTVVSTACVPFIPDVSLLWLLTFITGFSFLLINLAGHRLLLLMWLEKSSAPLHLLHTGYGIGACLIPILANPFLAVVTQQDASVTNATNITEYYARLSTRAKSASVSLAACVSNDTSVSNLSYSAKEREETLQESRVQYVFIMVAAFSLAMCLPFLVFQCLRKAPESDQTRIRTASQNPPRRFKEMLNPVTYTGGSMAYSLCVFALLTAFFLNVSGGENMFGTFVRSFAIDQLKFDKDDASFLNVVYWLSFSLGRFAASVVAVFVPIRRQILGEAIINALIVTLMIVISVRNATTLWVFVTLEGLIIGPLFPSGVAYANTIMDVTGVVIVAISIGASVGTFIFLWAAGKVYESFGPSAILYGLLLAGTLELVSIVGFLFLTRRTKKPCIEYEIPENEV